MDNSQIVSFIVETYALSPKLENKIIGIANRRVQELDITGFDNLYRYIAQLIDKFKTP